MRINPTIASQAINRYEKIVRQSTEDQASSIQPQDKVELSDRAKLYTSLVDAARESEPVDQTRVHAVLNRMATGQYTVDVKELAKKMLDITL